MVATQPNNSVEALTDRTVCLHIKDQSHENCFWKR